jgi:hypothetical protein
MNPLDDQLARLFRGAKPTGPAVTATPPYGLETRVLAAWRDAAGAVEGLWSPALLLRGLLLASVIMGLSLWQVWSTPSSPESEYLQWADASVPVGTNL